MKKLLITSLSLVSLIASNNGFCAGSDPTDDRTPAPTRVSPSSSNAGLHALAAAAAAAPQPLGVTSSSSSSSSSVAVAARDQRRRSGLHALAAAAAAAPQPLGVTSSSSSSSSSAAVAQDHSRRSDRYLRHPIVVVPTLKPFGSRPPVHPTMGQDPSAAAAASAVSNQLRRYGRSALDNTADPALLCADLSLSEAASAVSNQLRIPGRSALSTVAVAGLGGRSLSSSAASAMGQDTHRDFSAAAAGNQHRGLPKHGAVSRAAKRPRSDGEEGSISADAYLNSESDADSEYKPGSGNSSFPKTAKRPRRGSAAVASSGETSSSSSSSAASAAAAGSSASDDDASHPPVFTFKQEGNVTKLFYGKERLVSIYSLSRNFVSKSFRSLLNRLSEDGRPKKEQEEIVKMFMERFENVDLRIVFFKIFGRPETPLVTVLPFMEAVRRGDADLESVLTEAPASPFGRLSTSIDAIKKDPRQMFAIACQARAWKDAMSEKDYREQIEAPFKRIFGQSPDEIIDTKEESIVSSPADVLAVWKAQQVSAETTLRGFSSYLDFFHKVIAARSAAGQAGAAAASSGGTSSSSSSSAASAAAAGSSPSDDDASHPRVLTLQKDRGVTKLFYGEERLVMFFGHNRNDVSKSFRSLLNCLSDNCRPKKEREEIIKMFMEQFVNVDLRIVFSKPFGGRETPLVTVLPFMEAVRRGDAGLKSALTEESESLFYDLLSSIDAIKKDPRQMFAIACQARARKDAMSKKEYRVQIEAPFKRIFGQSPDEIIDTKEESIVSSPADVLAIFNARQNSVETKLHVFKLRLEIFKKVIADRPAAGQAGAAAASSGETSSSSSSSSAGPVAAAAASSGP